MRTKRIKLYQFSELSESAKQTAIDNFRDINTDYDWHETVYEDFKEICKTIGLTVDLSETYFSGFSHQGSSAAFTAQKNLIELINGIENKRWLSYAPNLQTDNKFNPSPCDIDKRVIDLIDRGWIDVSFSLKAEGRGYMYTKVEDYYTNYNCNVCSNYNNIEKELSKLEDWLQETVNDLCSLLYSLLEKEYEYLSSNESIIETIEANEYEFLETGKRPCF